MVIKTFKQTKEKLNLDQVGLDITWSVLFKVAKVPLNLKWKSNKLSELFYISAAEFLPCGRFAEVQEDKRSFCPVHIFSQILLHLLRVLGVHVRHRSTI